MTLPEARKREQREGRDRERLKKTKRLNEKRWSRKKTRRWKEDICGTNRMQKREMKRENARVNYQGERQ
jgi:hypothetical protein